MLSGIRMKNKSILNQINQFTPSKNRFKLDLKINQCVSSLNLRARVSLNFRDAQIPDVEKQMTWLPIEINRP